MFKGYNYLKNLKIAYDSYSDDFTFPGDRRRFCFFAQEINLSFTKYKRSLKYDVVILSPVSDLNEIKRLKKNGSKIIIEMVDAYLTKTPIIKDVIRYLGKQFIYKNYLNMFFPRRYTSQLKKSFKIADAVICTTEDQKKIIQKYNPNVHIILDSLEGDVFPVNSNRKNESNCLNILWEGLGSNLINFGEISSSLNTVSKEIKINLHILTDLVSYKYFSKYYKVYASDVMKKYNLNVNTYIYQWNQVALTSLASICDLAIIPILQNNEFLKGKPNNKLILLWKLGLPVFTSYSRVYSSTMKEAGLDMICKDEEDWISSLIKFNKYDNEKRVSISNQVREFANKNYTNQKLIYKWNNVFKSIL